MSANKKSGTVHSKTSLVWFSSQLSWRSSDVLSKRTSWHHQRKMSARHDDRHRSGWRHDRQCTTRLLYRTQHSYCPRSCHCPDLWLKKGSYDDQKENLLLSLETKYENMIRKCSKIKKICLIPIRQTLKTVKPTLLYRAFLFFHRLVVFKEKKEFKEQTNGGQVALKCKVIYLCKYRCWAGT